MRCILKEKFGLMLIIWNGIHLSRQTVLKFLIFLIFENTLKEGFIWRCQLFLNYLTVEEDIHATDTS